MEYNSGGNEGSTVYNHLCIMPMIVHLGVAMAMRLVCRNDSKSLLAGTLVPGRSNHVG